jgi:CRISPR/Cas system-associated endonuclease Cas1
MATAKLAKMRQLAIKLANRQQFVINRISISAEHKNGQHDEIKNTNASSARNCLHQFSGRTWEIRFSVISAWHRNENRFTSRQRMACNESKIQNFINHQK